MIAPPSVITRPASWPLLKTVPEDAQGSGQLGPGGLKDNVLLGHFATGHSAKCIPGAKAFPDCFLVPET